MIRRPPRSTQSRSSAASDVYKRQAPSDHWIEDEEAFSKDIHLAFEAAAKKEILITLGIKPIFPNTGYGYIKYKEDEESKLQKVVKFTEKPSLVNAKKFLKDGNYLWNAGIFIWKASFIACL